MGDAIGAAAADSSVVVAMEKETMDGLKRSVQSYSQWKELDETDNFVQKHDGNMARKEVEPSVREVIVKEAEEELLAALQNLRKQVGLAKKGKGKKGKGKGKKGKGKKKKK